jgi:hypothetical protein
MISARVGVPTFRDVRYGLSVLTGSVTVPGDRRVTAWRMAGDAVYRYHEPFTTVQGEFSFGADGGQSVWGMLAGLAQILPSHPRWQVLVQTRRWLSADPHTSATTEVTAGVGRALPYLMTLRVLLRVRSPGGGSLMAQLHYYAP